MAQRDLSNLRTVAPAIQQVPESTLATVAEIGQQIIKTGQEAKISENLSKATLELNALTNQYQIDNESNPMGGFDNFKMQRQAVLDKYGSEISPMYRGMWQQNARELGFRNDASNQAWAFKQTHVNTVNSVNTAMQNYLTQAQIDGENFGKGDGADIGAFLNFETSKKQLTEFGSANLGEETTNEMLKNYGSDYVKTFVSSVAQTNPSRALQLLDNGQVRGAFEDPEQFSKMKEAVEAKALNMDKFYAQKDVLGVLKNENSLLTRSLQSPISYAALQSEFQKSKIGPAAQEYFLKANGFTKSDAGGESLDASGKLNYKASLFNQLVKMTSPDADGKMPNLSTEDISKFQDSIYRGMNNKSLSQEEGLKFLTQLSNPMIQQKENALADFTQDSWVPNWFGMDSSVGFGGVQKIYEDRFQIKPEGKKSLTAGASYQNNLNQVKLYDYYMTALEEKAAAKGVEIGNLSALPDKSKQRQIYQEAQNEAVRMFMTDQNPSLSTMNDLPNQTFSGGKLIQGAAGDRGIKPDVSASGNFEFFEGSDGNVYRKYPDGRYEAAGKVK